MVQVKVTKKIKEFMYKGRRYNLSNYSIPDVIAGRATPISENNYVPTAKAMEALERKEAKQNEDANSAKGRDSKNDGGGDKEEEENKVEKEVNAEIK